MEWSRRQARLEYAKVMKDQIEFNTKMELKPDDVITLWVIRWAAMMVSRFSIGRDGRTAYERRWGKRCKIPVVPFGEKVWYKQLKETKDKKDKFNSDWHEGVWL